MKTGGGGGGFRGKEFAALTASVDRRSLHPWKQIQIRIHTAFQRENWPFSALEQTFLWPQAAGGPLCRRPLTPAASDTAPFDDAAADEPSRRSPPSALRH